MIAITGGKGGCGKTTITLGVANALARLGHDPLVVDGDCDMPDIHHRVSVPRTPCVDAVADGTTLQDVIHRSDAIAGAATIPAGRRQNLGQALTAARRWAGPVLVDCAAGTNEDALVPLRHADRSVIVSTDGPQCLEDADRTARVATRLDATPARVIVRETAPHNDPVAIPESELLVRIPSVDTPLSHQQIKTELLRVSKSIVNHCHTQTEQSQPHRSVPASR